MATRRGGASVLYRRRQESETKPPDRGGLGRVATAAAGALGLVGYLYALGGIVIWLRLEAAQLPTDGSIVAADDRHLLAIGVQVVIFEVALLLAISLVVSLLVGIAVLKKGKDANIPNSEDLKFKEAWGSMRSLGGFVGPGTALLLVSVGLSLQGSTALRTVVWVAGLLLGIAAARAMIFRLPIAKGTTRRGKPRKLRALAEPRSAARKTGLRVLRVATIGLLPISIGVGVAVVPLLQGTLLLAGTAMIYSGPFLKWPDKKRGNTFGVELLRSGGIWAAIAFATAVALAWVATPPVAFTRAVVEPLDRSNYHYGAYLDRGDNGIYLGSCRRAATSPSPDDHEASTRSHIVLIPTEEGAHVRLGQRTYQFDPGGRPSIWQTLEELVTSGAPGVRDALLHHPLRGQAAKVCGTDSPPQRQRGQSLKKHPERY